MTVTQKVIMYLCGLTIFLLWETMFVVQMFRGFESLSAMLILFGVGAFAYFVQIVRTEPLRQD